MNNIDEKAIFINDYKDQFSFIPLKGEPGKMKEPAITGWQRYCRERSDFTVEELVANNYGIATGPASNLLVVDIDDAEVFESFLRRNDFALPERFVVETGNGRHVGFKYPDDGNEYGNRAYGSLGFDVRGMGGYVVAPHSLHEETGKYYELVKDGFIPELPDFLKHYVQNVSGTKKPDIDNIRNKQIVELIRNGSEVGQRSESMFKVVLSLIANKYNDDQIFYIFNKYAIGDKYLEKPEHLRDEWLQGQLDRAREFASNTKVAVEPVREVDIPEISYLSANELLEKECKVEWLVDDLIEKGGNTLVTGKSGIGKSMFILNLALALATAPENGVMGCNIPKPLRVMIIQCENSEAFMRKRLEDVCRINPEFAKGRDNVQFVYFNGRHDYQNFKFSNDNLDLIVSKINEDRKPDLLIIDPYKSYSGVSENDNDANRAVLDKLFYILAEHDITSIIVHHHGKGGEYEGTDRSRGASAITDTVSNHWTLSRKEDKDTHVEQLVVECTKSRNSQKFEDTYLEIVRGLYFKPVDTPFDPKMIIDLLVYNDGSCDTKGKLIDLIRDKTGASEFKASSMIKEAEKNRYIIGEKYGQNKIKYTLPLSMDAA